MVKQNIVMVGQKTPNNIIFLFCANGKRYKTIELEPLIEGLTSATRWSTMQFNSDEDLILMTSEARIFVLDIFLGKIKDKFALPGFSDRNSAIEEGKLQAWQPKAPGKEEQVECDALIFRTRA